MIHKPNGAGVMVGSPELANWRAGLGTMAGKPETDPVRETLFHLLIDSGLLRPAPVSYQVAEAVNGRAYRIVPIGVVWPRSCLHYAAQDARLQRELLLAIYERKTIVDGGLHERRPMQSPFELPSMTDGGWVHPMEPSVPEGPAEGEGFRRITPSRTR